LHCAGYRKAYLCRVVSGHAGSRVGEKKREDMQLKDIYIL